MSIINPISLIPPQYKILVYVAIVTAIFFGGFYTGYDWAASKYKAQVAALEFKMELFALEKEELASRIEASLANVREVIITKYVDRVKVIKQKEYVYVEQATNVVPDRTELSNGWVSVHDAAARGEDADSTRAADGTGSGVAANQALGVIAQNYAACHQNAEQLTALQEYVREAQRIVAEANARLSNRKRK